jgi:molybdopterin molybdotransferase
MRTVEDAQGQVLARVAAKAPETVALDDARFCVLRESIVARRNLPAVDNSAMDGFAVRSEDLPGTVDIAGTVKAGDPPGAVLRRGQALRIMTGAPIPEGADAVVMQENATVLERKVKIDIGPRRGDHIRRTGEDVRAGTQVLGAGVELGAGEIGLLAALGVTRVAVSKPPVVAILATGDELVPIGVEPGPGQHYASSSHALAVQIAEAGGRAELLGVAPDDRDALTARIQKGLGADVLLTTGGVSVGEFDLVRAALEAVGVTLDFYKVAMKPGKPLVFAVAPSGSLIFGLPGNPVSSMVAFELFVRPALKAMQGSSRVMRPRLAVVLERAYEKAAGRAHYVRATLDLGMSPPRAHPASDQGSGSLTSMVGIDVLVEIAKDCTRIEAGTPVPALLVRWS